MEGIRIYFMSITLFPNKIDTGSLPGVKRPERGVDHPPPSSSEVKEIVELYIYSPSALSWRVIG